MLSGELEGAFARNSEVRWTEMDGDTVVLDTERNAYFGLGGIGSRIWELLAEPITVEEISSSIQAEFDIDPKRCEEDVIHFLNELSTHDIIRRCSAT